MEVSYLLSKHLHNVHYGGNWTEVNLKDLLEDINWQEALITPFECNSIADLTYHIHYFTQGVNEFLETGELKIRDKFSFDRPEINSEKDWQDLKALSLATAASFSENVARIEESKWEEDFIDPKYSSYFTNFLGIIEHCHYHLGQIAILKKIIRSKDFRRVNG